jgi:hypothetical protein
LTEQGYSYFIQEWDEESGGICPIDLASISI